jgi:hypothetical protein
MDDFSVLYEVRMGGRVPLRQRRRRLRSCPHPGILQGAQLHAQHAAVCVAVHCDAVGTKASQSWRKTPPPSVNKRCRRPTAESHGAASRRHLQHRVRLVRRLLCDIFFVWSIAKSQQSLVLIFHSMIWMFDSDRPRSGLSDSTARALTFPAVCESLLTPSLPWYAMAIATRYPALTRPSHETR